MTTATAQAKDRTHIPVSSVLHSLIKSESERSGRLMRRIIEEKLWELFPDDLQNPFRNPQPELLK
jgi:hypothetical protein